MMTPDAELWRIFLGWRSISFFPSFVIELGRASLRSGNQFSRADSVALQNISADVGGPPTVPSRSAAGFRGRTAQAFNIAWLEDRRSRRQTRPDLARRQAGLVLRSIGWGSLLIRSAPTASISTRPPAAAPLPAPPQHFLALAQPRRPGGMRPQPPFIRRIDLISQQLPLNYSTCRTRTAQLLACATAAFSEHTARIFPSSCSALLARGAPLLRRTSVCRLGAAVSSHTFYPARQFLRTCVPVPAPSA